MQPRAGYMILIEEAVSAQITCVYIFRKHECILDPLYVQNECVGVYVSGSYGPLARHAPLVSLSGVATTKPNAGLGWLDRLSV